MSADTADDLEYLEDTIATLRAALRDFIELDDVGDFTDLVETHRGLLDEDYCRPTCGGYGDECGDDCCGCLCHLKEDSDATQ